MEKIKIIYFVGMGHSGSTLIDLILGTSKNCVSMGELEYFTDFLKDENAPEMDKHPQSSCVCGKKFKDCSYWKSILAKVDDSKCYNYESSLAEKLKIALSMYLPLKVRFNTAGHETLFKQILEQASKNKGSKVEYIIDSSMDVRRMIYLSQVAGVELKVIHLVRDARGVVNSFEKIGRFWLRTMFEWKLTNMIAKRFLKKNLDKKDYMLLSYDLFAQHPKKYLSRIKKKFDLSLNVEGFIDAVNKQEYHQVGGNRMNMRKLEAIRHDLSWKKRLPSWKRAILSVLAYVPNRWWVFGKNVQ